jgi:predicted enzyme related to lactoylglutathione lyase
MTEARESAGPHALRAPGTPCWVSLMAHGLTATEEFYGALFGWEFRPGPRQLGPYVRALLDGREVAGIGQLPPDRQLPTAWTPYFASDDVNRTAETVRLCGGTVGVGPLDAGEAGRMAIGSDPAGAVFGIWQAAAHLGTAVAGVPGTPAWNELLTYETTGVAKFYETVFGWSVTASRRYPQWSIDGADFGGMVTMDDKFPHEVPAHWLPYFAVEDVDTAAADTTDGGGTVLMEPTSPPDGPRIAVLRDPQGAMFGVYRAGDER